MQQRVFKAAGWIDVHAHLDRLPDDQLKEAIAQAHSAGVGTIVSTATDIESAGRVAGQCRSFPQLYGTAGISPFDTEDPPAGWEADLRALLEGDEIIAVGEIGIDRSNPKYPSMEKQLPVFQRQLEIAAALALPAVVHSRGAEKEAAEICIAAGCKKALFHCFTGSADALEFILESGFYISFSGIVTFNNTVRDLIPKVPLDRIFIETDTPYLAPVPHRGQTNQPAWVVHSGETVAKSKGISTDQLKTAIVENFVRLFFDAAMAGPVDLS